MQKLILSLLMNASKTNSSTPSETKTQPMKRLSRSSKTHHHPEDTDTRPTYRIGKHNPSDIHKVIDLSG